MERRARFTVVIGGSDITPTLIPLVNSIRISDAAGTHADTCSIEIDDSDGRVILPPVGVDMIVSLGWQGEAATQLFVGKVDEVKGSGSRSSGRTLSVSAKGLDTLGKAKEHQQLHIDNANIETALTKAGKAAGITSVKVAPELKSITREYWALDGESFIAFGERVAREIGGVFKLQGNRAVMGKKGSGESPTGAALPTVTGRWGDNLISYDITPTTGRPRFKKVRARYYDKKTAKWMETDAEIEDDKAQALHIRRNTVADEGEAKGATENDKAESANQKGGGSVTIDGNGIVTPEGTFILSGTRPGIDGAYRIETVQHEYSRSGGWTTQLSLKRPDGDAGKDTR